MISPIAWRVAEANARAYRRVWKGSVVTTFLNPILFLAAMGMGLGTLVDRGVDPVVLEGLGYMAFIGPAMLAASAMQTGASEGSWPVMAGIKWVRTFHAALATPVGVADLVTGYLGWIGARLLLSSVVFVGVITAFGAVSIGPGLLAVAPAVLTGLAFAAPVMAFTATLEREPPLASLYRFGIVPMFLMSGTFFPVTQLPQWLEYVAYATPLWHGVELCRAIALGTGTQAWPIVHVGYLALWTGIGWFLAIRYMKRRLQP